MQILFLISICFPFVKQKKGGFNSLSAWIQVSSIVLKCRIWDTKKAEKQRKRSRKSDYFLVFIQIGHKISHLICTGHTENDQRAKSSLEYEVEQIFWTIPVKKMGGKK